MTYRSNDVFTEVKESVDMAQVVESYGIKINHGGVACCPFHKDKSPSMKVYKKSFYCFGCQTGGDVVKFVELREECSPLEACKILIDLFNLPIAIGKPRPLTFEEQYKKMKRESQRKENERFEKVVAQADKVLSECHRYLWRGLTQYPPNDERHIRALRNINVLEYDLECLDREPMAFIADGGLEVVKKYETNLDRWNTEDGGF